MICHTVIILYAHLINANSPSIVRWDNKTLDTAMGNIALFNEPPLVDKDDIFFTKAWGASTPCYDDSIRMNKILIASISDYESCQ